MTDTEELEELWNAPAAQEPDQKEKSEEKTEPNWAKPCSILDGGLHGKKTRCAKPSKVYAHRLCPFCGIRKAYYCSEHFAALLNGDIYCTGCSEKANAIITIKPASAIFKAE